MTIFLDCIHACAHISVSSDLDVMPRIIFNLKRKWINTFCKGFACGAIFKAVQNLISIFNEFGERRRSGRFPSFNKNKKNYCKQATTRRTATLKRVWECWMRQKGKVWSAGGGAHLTSCHFICCSQQLNVVGASAAEQKRKTVAEQLSRGKSVKQKWNKHLGKQTVGWFSVAQRSLAVSGDKSKWASAPKEPYGWPTASNKQLLLNLLWFNDTRLDPVVGCRFLHLPTMELRPVTDSYSPNQWGGIRAFDCNKSQGTAGVCSCTFNSVWKGFKTWTRCGDFIGSHHFSHCLLWSRPPLF